MGEDDLIASLTRFHREVVRPDFERVMADAAARIARDFAGHCDAIHARFDRLDAQCGVLAAGLARIEVRLDRVEQRLDNLGV